MLSQLSSNIAQSLISSKSNRSGDKELLQIPVATPVEKQMPHSVITSDPPTGVMTPTADTLKAVTLTESDPTSTRENTTSESGAVTASGTVPLPVTAGPEGVEGAAAVGVGTGNPPPPREGQMRTRGMGRRGSRRRKVIPPVPQAIGGGGDEASNVG